jgi:hypothetical protein
LKNIQESQAVNTAFLLHDLLVIAEAGDTKKLTGTTIKKISLK